jgi:hypothetical protein
MSSGIDLGQLVFRVGFGVVGFAILFRFFTVGRMIFRRFKPADKTAKADLQLALKQLEEQLDAALRETNLGVMAATLQVADDQIKALRIPGTSKIVAKRNELRILLGQKRGESNKPSKS